MNNISVNKDFFHHLYDTIILLGGAMEIANMGGNCKTRNLVEFCNQWYDEPRGASQILNSAACGGESTPFLLI